MTKRDSHNEAAKALLEGEIEFGGAVTFEHDPIAFILAAE